MGLRNRNLSNNDGDDDQEIFDEFDDFTAGSSSVFDDYSGDFEEPLSNNDNFEDFDQDFTDDNLDDDNFNDDGFDDDFDNEFDESHNGSAPLRPTQPAENRSAKANSVTTRSKKAKSLSLAVKWVVRGRHLQVGTQVYNLRQAYTYGYEPAKLSYSSNQDSTPIAYLAYQFPVPGAQRYFVNSSSIEGKLRPVDTVEQLQQVRNNPIVWMVVFTRPLA